MMKQSQDFWFSSDGDLARAAGLPVVPDCLKDGIRHAAEVLKGRWPQWEKIALHRAANNSSALSSCVTYAEKVVEGVWPELEPLLLTAANTDGEQNDAAIEYCRRVIRGPWDVLEHAILRGDCDPRVAVMYAKEVRKSRWDALETLLLGTVPTGESCLAFFMYSCGLVRGRWPAAEEYLLNPAARGVAANAAYFYAWLVICGRWQEAEELLVWNPSDMLSYADDVVGGRLPPRLHGRMLLLGVGRPDDEHIEQYFKKYGR